MNRAKAAGFTALVVTLDTFILGWRPHDLDTAASLPFAAGLGAQVGTSDPVFMQSMGLPVRPDERPAFPFDREAFRKQLAAGDERAAVALKIGGGWSEETSGKFRTWENLAFLRENWDGPLVVKGIQTVEDAHAAMEAHMDGIVVSNHGTFDLRTICVKSKT